MKQLTPEILKEQGFEYEEQLNAYVKTIGSRTIRCHKPNINVNAGYWVCDIWASFDPVQNNKIATADDLQKFIDSCCPDNTIKIAAALDIN